ncbi:MAG: glycyl-radical enzyme activating protein, partial [Clostridia bacterium]|nr:glycyl-radical enzyme activating protein [Clostridia bacterium]
TFNDTEEEIGAIAAFAREIGAQEIHLLPYHRIGSDKYAGLGRAYEMADIRPPEKERMQALLAVAEQAGIRGRIGG